MEKKNYQNFLNSKNKNKIWLIIIISEWVAIIEADFDEKTSKFINSLLFILYLAHSKASNEIYEWLSEPQTGVDTWVYFNFSGQMLSKFSHRPKWVRNRSEDKWNFKFISYRHRHVQVLNMI